LDDVTSLSIKGTDSDGKSVSYVFAVEDYTTFNDLVTDIESRFGDVEVTLNSNAQIVIKDLGASKDERTYVEFSMGAHNLQENIVDELQKLSTSSEIDSFLDGLHSEVEAFSPIEALANDGVKFKKSVSTLSSNMSQIVKSTDRYANEDTKLSEVAGGDLDGTKLKMQIQDINGNPKNFLVEFYNDRVVVGEDSNNNGKLDEAMERAYNIINEKNNFLTAGESDEPTSLINLNKNSNLNGMHIGDEVVISSENFMTYSDSTLDTINFMHPTNLHIAKVGQEIIIDGERRTIKEVNHTDIPKNLVLDRPLSHAPTINTKASMVGYIADVDKDNKSIRLKDEVPFRVQRNTNIALQSGQIATAQSITYSQLMDAISMSLTGEFPPNNKSQDEYIKAVDRASKKVDVSLNHQGQINIRDLKNSKTKIEFSLSDIDTNRYDGVASTKLYFNANNSFTVDEPNLDFFNNLDEMIKSVEYGVARADNSNGVDARLKGIQNSLHQIDHLNSHMSKMQTDIGVQSKRFDDTIARNEMLLVHTNELKSDVEDTDLAEASMRLQQNSLGYQAMLQTIQKMNGLSLVNYMR